MAESLTVEYIAPLPGDQRYATFPVSRPAIWKFYKRQIAQFWVAEEVHLADDKQHYQQLTEGRRQFLDVILAFFACMDKIININIARKFKTMFNIYEIDLFYDAQTTIENIHGEVYSLMLDTYITDPVYKQKLINGWVNNPAVAKIAAWVKYVYESPDMDASEALFRIALIEGVIFPMGFVPIYWLTDSKEGLMPGLAYANEMIARDETLHKLFGTHMQSELKWPIKENEARAIANELIPVCKLLAEECIPKDLPEMKTSMFLQYARCLIDTMMEEHGFAPIFGDKNPFPFMEKIMLNNKTNFFERQVSEYNKNTSQTKYEVANDF